MAAQRGAIEEPGPSMSRNHAVNAAAATIAVTTKIRPEHAVALVVAGRAAQQPPDVVQPRGDHQRDDQRADEPEERGGDARGTRCRPR